MKNKKNRMGQRLLAAFCAAVMLLFSVPNGALVAHAAGSNVLVTVSGAPTEAMKPGATATLTADVTSDTAPVENPVVVWTSSDSTVAKVDANTGVVTAVARSAAAVTITATYTEAGTDYSGTALVSVTYSDPTGVTIDGGGSVNEGSTLSLTASVQPATAEQKVTWSSSDSAIATVSADGTVTGVKRGNATITAAAGTVSAKKFVAVTTTLATASFADPKPSVTYGSTYTQVPTVSVGGAAVTYASSDTSVAAVDQNGKVTPVSAGTAKITASFTKLGYYIPSCTYTLTVNPKTLTISEAEQYSRFYNATNQYIIPKENLVGVVGSDDVSLELTLEKTGSIDGSPETFKVTGFRLAGTGAGKYAFSLPADGLSVTVEKLDATAAFTVPDPDATDYTGTEWYNVEHKLTAASGFGLSAELSAAAKDYLAELPFGGQGAQEQSGRAMDVYARRASDGAIGKTTFPYNLDKTAPSLSFDFAYSGSGRNKGIVISNLTASDAASGIASLEPDATNAENIKKIQFVILSKKYTTLDEMNTALGSALQWNDISLQNGKLVLPNEKITALQNGRSYIYFKVSDNAGNTTLRSNFFLQEDVAPSITDNSADTTTVYPLNGTQQIDLNIADKGVTDTTGEAISGLKTVSAAAVDLTDPANPQAVAGYEVTAKDDRGNEVDLTQTFEMNKATGASDTVSLNRTFAVTAGEDAKKDQNLFLRVTAVDQFGNTTTIDVPLRFDVKAPTVAVSYKAVDAPQDEIQWNQFSGAEYTNRAFTVTYTVTDNNALNPADFTASAAGPNAVAFTAPTESAGTLVYTATVSQEGHYTFSFTGSDVSDNQIPDQTSAEKVLDQTQPVVSMQFRNASGSDAAFRSYNGDNNDYINEAFTAVYTITDNEALAHAEAAGYVVSEEGTLTYTQEVSAEGSYEFPLTITDAAGNSLKLAGNETVLKLANGQVSVQRPKVLDTTAPVAKVTLASGNVYGKTVYYGTSAANGNLVDVKVTDANTLENSLLGIAFSKRVDAPVANDAEQGTFTFPVLHTDSYTSAFPKDDGVYALQVSGTDKAGNSVKIEGAENYDTKNGAWQSSNLVVDRTAPTVAMDATVPENTVNGISYQKNASADLVVTETNFDSGKIGAVIASDPAVGHWSDANPVWGAVTPGDGYVSGKTYRLSAAADGAYRFEIAGADKAGNPIAASAAAASYNKLSGTDKGLWSEIKVVDTTAPTYRLNIWNGDGTVYYAMSDGTVAQAEPYRSETAASGSIAGSDKSPIQITYTQNSTVAGSRDLQAGYGNDQNSSFSADGEQVFWLENLTLTDLAGNSVSLGSTNRIYLDVEAPAVDELAPTISVVATADGNSHNAAGNPLFDQDVPLQITVSDPYASERSSGLGEVTYALYVNGAELDASTLHSAAETSFSGNYADAALEFNLSNLMSVSAADHNYNDLRAVVTARDNAGNMSTREYSFGIDTTAPTASVVFDNNDVQNEKYFKADRTATVTVTERNFDPAAMKIDTEAGASISGWSYLPGTSANGDDDRHVATITYSGDGDYTLNMTGADLLGHSAAVTFEGAAAQAFTVDKTAPVFHVSYNNNDVQNGHYYKAGRIATVQVDEHNFRASDVSAAITAGLAEGSVATPSLSGFAASGDLNSATVDFTKDGDYTLAVRYTDLAGNPAVDYGTDAFTVDQTAPTLEITGVRDRMAYNGDVAPVITYHDVNYDAASAGISITGVMHKTGENLTGSRTEDSMGGSFTCSNLEAVRGNDDVYTATGTVRDLAGNETQATVVFSVNRFGSTYILSDDTKGLVDGYYTNSPRTLNVTEINVNSLTKREVSLSLGGEVITLTEGKDYTVQESAPGWKQYDYAVNADNFTKDGAYTVTFYSEDEATNRNSNSAIRQDGNQTNQLPVEFLVDRTAPTNVITGVEQNQQYVSSSRVIMVNFEDNTGLQGLTIYLDGTPVATYTAEQLAQAGNSVTYTAAAGSRWQEFTVESVDVAGNTSSTAPIRYLLTSNLLIQAVNNTAVLIGLIVLILLITALIIFLSRKKKQKKQPA